MGPSVCIFFNSIRFCQYNEFMAVQAALFEVPLITSVLLALRTLAQLRPAGSEYWAGLLISIGFASFLGCLRFASDAPPESLLLKTHLFSVQVSCHRKSLASSN